MPLERRSTSKFWYGRFEVGGKRVSVSLRVPVRGRPPSRRGEPGDSAFEASRARAQAKLEQRIEEAHAPQTSARMIERLHEIKYGTPIESVALAEITDLWDRIPKKSRALSPRYVQDVHATLRRFTEFMNEKHPGVADMGQITRQMARGFLDAESARHVADKTWNDSLKRLRAVFRFAQTEYGVPSNPFDGIRRRREAHIHRKPFTEDEIKAILEAAAPDEIMCPILICGLSTAMREGDCCRLRWRDVRLDTAEPSICAKTGKTGETVWIPIFRRLHDVLLEAQRVAEPAAEYVWPAAAALYEKNPSAIGERFAAILTAAGIKETTRERTGQEGKRRASLKDFHSLRTTWVTEALSRGVPIETVKRITGHRTTEVVTQHYYRPDAVQVRASLARAMPAMLTDGDVAPDTEKDELAEAADILTGMTSKSWRRDRDRAMALLRAIPRDH